jgi:TldD protein
MAQLTQGPGRQRGDDMRSVLRQALQMSAGAAANEPGELVELRYHKKVFRSVSVLAGRVERSTNRHREGVGVRVLSRGTWGFASTGDASVGAIRTAIDRARRAARATAAFRSAPLPSLPAVDLAVGDFEEPGVEEILGRSAEERLSLAMGLESEVRRSSPQICSATGTYNEIYEEKAVVTSDGADCAWRLVRPELSVSAVAERDGQRTDVAESIGVTGGWDCLFRTAPAALAERAAASAIDLLSARTAEGGRAKIILSPSLVGLLVHEAIGHTVEADFVHAGSVAKGKLGQRVGSELVTLVDSGHSEHHKGAGGTIPVDDEGVLSQRTVVIERGILKSYLHNRESAARDGLPPTGNARAWEYADQPLIRMRNTCIEPGTASLEEMIASTDEGFLLEGPRNGQADSTGEFMFGVRAARRIHKGKVGELLRGVTVTGNAFEVLESVDAVSTEFQWDLGSGHCGKGQPAKVDAGGPWLRCSAMLGGV